jgi:dolichol kinase
MDIDRIFFLHQFVLLTICFCLYYVTGELVRSFGVRVNYTRKINHFAIFFLPIFLDLAFVYEKSPLTKVLGLVIAISTVFIFIEPFRERSSIIRTMFLGFDRPEDRPHTVRWLATQYIAAAIVIIPLAMYLDSVNLEALAIIPLLINGLGDGFAEPIGVRFGRHHYTARALFSDKIYQRSLEGSFCVFAAGILSILAFDHLFTAPQFLAALLTVPLATTFAEAYSPHTWDTPFIFGVAGVLLIAIVTFL